MTEEEFLREKNVTLYEHDTTTVDYASGEIIEQSIYTKKKTSLEPDYIKVYYKTMLAVNGIDKIKLDFLLILSAQINYANADSKMYFYNNKVTSRAIGEDCQVTDSMCNKYIKIAENNGILFKTGDRGVYEVNPWMIAKGKWENIKKLQTEFEYVNGKWRRTIEYKQED